MKRVLLATVFGLIVAMALPAAARKWTSKDGRFSTEAELVEFDDPNVTLQKPSGKTVTMELDRLCQADRRFVRAWAKKHAASKKKAAGEVSYVNDVQPFLVTYCSECHNQGKAAVGYDVTSYAALVGPGKKGPMVVPGKPGESRLILTRQGKGEFMPPAGSPQPTAEETAKIAAWIEAGAEDDTAGQGQQKPRSGKSPR
jgi:mono/diheme cytochrome c family protein